MKETPVRIRDFTLIRAIHVIENGMIKVPTFTGNVLQREEFNQKERGEIQKSTVMRLKEHEYALRLQMREHCDRR